MKKLRKTIRKIKKKLDPRPVWCKKVVITPKDVLDACEFWPEFGLSLPKELQAMKIKFEAGCPMTLDDQKLIARTILSEFAKRTCSVFMDSFFKDISVECAQQLAVANKHD